MIIKADLSGANLSNAELYRANLSLADLKNADLRNADLSEAILLEAKLNKAKLNEATLKTANFHKSDLRGATFCNADLRDANFYNANLSSTFLRNANLLGCKFFSANLHYASLNNANLECADLNEADLSNADLFEANLKDAFLVNANLRNTLLLGIQARRTIFVKSDFTGACIEDWNINSETNFENVKCEYIYRTYDYPKMRNRLPTNPEHFFKPGEFEEWIKVSAEAQQTIDLTFNDGIDWQAFFQSLQSVRQEYPDANIGLQAIEKKGSAFVIRLEASADADQGAIELTQKDLYETQLQLREAQGEIRVLREMSDILKQLAGKAMNKPTNQTNNYAQTIGVQHSGSGNISDFYQSISNKNRKTPAESAKEIQDMLIHLQSTNPIDIQSVVEEKVKSDPTLRDHIRNALKEGGLEIMKVIFPLTGIAIETVKGWVEAEGKE